MFKSGADPIVGLAVGYVCGKVGNRCFRFVSWLIFSNLAFQTILIQYLMSDKTNPQIQILTITERSNQNLAFPISDVFLLIEVYFVRKNQHFR